MCSCRAPCFHNGRTRADAAVVIDHAESGHHRGRRISHLRASGRAQYLAQRFNEADETTRGPGLTGRQLSAGRVVRKVSGNCQVAVPDEIGAPPLSQKPRSSICIIEMTG